MDQFNLVGLMYLCIYKVNLHECQSLPNHGSVSQGPSSENKREYEPAISVSALYVSYI